MAQAHLAFTIDMAPDAVYANVDPTRMAQVIGNLLHNAAKYTPAAGHVTLALRRDQNDAVIDVRDSGVGIPRAMLARVFDMFIQVENSLPQAQGGLGIGLSLVRKLVELHGGTVEVASDPPGSGSTFSIRLPVADAPVDAGALCPKATTETASGTCRVLIVDDNMDAAETLAMMMEFWGCQTRTAFTGPDAIAVAQTFLPQLVLLDIGLPGMNGREVARALRASAVFESTLLVALTGWGSPEDVRRAIEAGFDLHLTKPVEPARIRELVARLSPGADIRSLS